jgi:NDP-sugar pyrophosphorylase family protein
MYPLTEACPKTLLPVCGRPFAWHQLHWLAAHGVTEVVYSIGHQGDQIRRYWETEPPPVPALRYVDEGTQLRGTGGALRLAFDQGALNGFFFVLYGDSFLPVDFGPVGSAFEASRAPALMTVLRNQGRWDRSNAVYAEGRVMLYDKHALSPQMDYIDYGLSALRREVIERIKTPVFDLSTLYHDLSVAGELAGYEVTQRFYEIGSPQGLRDLEEYVGQVANVANLRPIANRPIWHC